jgi:iron complex outermembrane receptor protein
MDGAILIDTGGGNYALHADAYGRKATDYTIPSYPYLFDPAKPFNGRQPNSAAQGDGASVGGSYLFHGGFIGAAITQTDTLYRIPGIDGADHQTRIDAHQTKLTAKGEYRPDAAAIDTTITTTKSGSPIPPIPRRSASVRPSPTKSRKAASKCR